MEIQFCGNICIDHNLWHYQKYDAWNQNINEQPKMIQINIKQIRAENLSSAWTLLLDVKNDLYIFQGLKIEEAKKIDENVDQISLTDSGLYYVKNKKQIYVYDDEEEFELIDLSNILNLEKIISLENSNCWGKTLINLKMSNILI